MFLIVYKLSVEFRAGCKYYELATEFKASCKKSWVLLQKLNNNLYLYYKAKDYKLDFCFKKQALVTLKSYGAQVAATLGKIESDSRTLYKLKAILNFLV